MRYILFITCLLNLTNVFGQCSVTFTTQPSYCGLCNGSINITPIGQPPYTYTWSSGQTTQNISGICNGVYSLTVLDASACSSSLSIVVGNNDGWAFVTGTDATCNGCCDGTGEITVTVGYPPYTYLWCGGQTTSSVSTLCAGTCSIQIIDSMGCFVYLSLTINEPATGINEHNLSSSISVFPNPSNQNTTLSFDNLNHENYTLTILDTHGRVVKTIKDIKSDKVQIETTNFIRGLYFFQLYNDKQIIATTKLAIE